jgi:hypothetical protein
MNTPSEKRDQPFSNLVELTTEKTESVAKVNHATQSVVKPLNLAFWLDEQTGLGVSTNGEYVVLRDLFPLYQRLGQLIQGHDFYTTMVSVDVRGEPCYKPVRFTLLHLLDAQHGERKLLVVDEVRTERELVRRRHYLLSLFAGAGWHYAANLATAGFGYLGFLERHFESEEAQKVVGGISKALKGVKECTYLVCALAKSHDGSREISLKEAVDLLARFCKGIFAPDLVVTATPFEPSTEQHGHRRGLVNETPLFHLILEIVLMVYKQGVRKVDFNVMSPHQLIIAFEKEVVMRGEFGYAVASNLGVANKMRVSLSNKKEIQCIIQDLDG